MQVNQYWTVIQFDIWSHKTVFSVIRPELLLQTFDCVNLHVCVNRILYEIYIFIPKYTVYSILYDYYYLQIYRLIWFAFPAEWNTSVPVKRWIWSIIYKNYSKKIKNKKLITNHNVIQHYHAIFHIEPTPTFFIVFTIPAR